MSDTGPLSLTEILSTDDRPKSKDALVRVLVMGSPDGVSVAELHGATGISESHIRNVLHQLESDRHVYSSPPSGRNKKYFPNGKMLHELGQVEEEIGPDSYVFTVHEGRYGRHELQVKEVEYSLVAGRRVKGSVFVKVSGLRDMILKLTAIADRLEAGQPLTGGEADV